MSALVKLARLFPPIRRLHDDRARLVEAHQALSRSIDKFQSEQTALDAELAVSRTQLNTLQQALHSAERGRETNAEVGDFGIAALRSQVNQLKLQSDYVANARADGRMPEFDYPYAPRVRDWDKLVGGNVYRAMIARNDDCYRERLQDFLRYTDKFAAIELTEPSDEAQPYWNNGWFASADGIGMYGLIATLNPRRYVEVGSGNSTKFVRRAIRDNNLRTQVTSIDPMPRAVIDTLCDNVIREKLEDVDLALFDDLGSEDVVFIDNSHRSFQNSDVTIFFTEILPKLKSGCHYGIHDIFLPFDYPESWAQRFYNEQYLLMCYLLGGASGDEIIMPVHHVFQDKRLLSILAPILGQPNLHGAHQGGGAFWMKRK